MPRAAVRSWGGFDYGEGRPCARGSEQRGGVHRVDRLAPPPGLVPDPLCSCEGGSVTLPWAASYRSHRPLPLLCARRLLRLRGRLGWRGGPGPLEIKAFACLPSAADQRLLPRSCRGLPGGLKLRGFQDRAPVGAMCSLLYTERLCPAGVERPLTCVHSEDSEDTAALGGPEPSSPSTQWRVGGQ